MGAGQLSKGRVRLRHFLSPLAKFYGIFEYIFSTKNEKELRVIIDNDLKYHVQTASATKKANQISGSIKKILYT